MPMIQRQTFVILLTYMVGCGAPPPPGPARAPAPSPPPSFSLGRAPAQVRPTEKRTVQLWVAPEAPTVSSIELYFQAPESPLPPSTKGTHGAK